MATVGEKMSKGRKAAHVEETMEESGECDPGMLLVLKAIMEEQRKNDIAREEARERAEEKREERREEARLRREEESLRRQQEYQKQQEVKQAEQQEMLEKRQAEQQELLEKRAAEKQELLEKRQLEHQRQLVEMQAEVGRKASILHREQANEDKKRDRALFGVPTFREGEDLEEFLVLMEERMIAAGVEKDEWVASVSSKLTGRLAASWREVTAAAPDYEGARIRFLEGSGYTPIAAADRFFGFKFEQCKGLSAGELYQKGVKLVRRILGPCVISPESEFALLKGWVYTVIPKRARASLDARVVTKAAELVAALQDFLTLEGESGTGVTAVFRSRVGEGFRERSSLTCFTCGKIGHKAIDCWQEKGGASAPREGAAGQKPKIVCFTCGVEGHKSPQCPMNIRTEEGDGKRARPRPINRIWIKPSGCAQLEGVVNGHEAQVVLDSGADISVVPENLVHPSQLDGRSMAVRPFGATEPMILPVAEIAFQVGELEWTEKVAVAPRLEGKQGEVLCRLDIKSKRGLELVMLANEIDVKEVACVTTRSKDKAEKQQMVEDRALVALDQPKVRALVPSGQEVVNEPREEVELKVDGKGVLGDKVEECSCALGFEVKSSEEEVLDSLVELFSKDSEKIAEEEVLDGLVDLKEEDEEMVVDLFDSSFCEGNMVVPPVIAGTLDRAAPVAEACTKEFVSCLGENYNDILGFEEDSLVDKKEDETVSVMDVEFEVEIVGSRKVDVEIVEVEVGGIVENKVEVEVGVIVENKVEVEVEEVEVEKVEAEKVEIGEVEVDAEVVGIGTVEVEVLSEEIVKLEEIVQLETLGLGKRCKFKDECLKYGDWIEGLKNKLLGAFAAGLGGFGAWKLEPREIGLGKVPESWKTNLKEEVDRMLELAVPGHRATARVDFGIFRSKEQLWTFLGSFVLAQKSIFEMVWEFVIFVAWKLAVEFSWKVVFLVNWKFFVELARKFIVMAAWKFEPTVVTWEPEMLEACNFLNVSLCNCYVLYVPGEGDVFVLHSARKEPEEEQHPRMVAVLVDGDVFFLHSVWKEPEEDEHPRTAVVSVGGDVGITPLE